MLGKGKAYSGFAVEDMSNAKDFYGETLGIEIKVLDEQNGLMELQLEGGKRPTLCYQQPGTTPASYTILNFPVDDIEAAVDALAERGVSFERYEGTGIETDEKGIFRGGGPLIAWFKDPAGNVLSVIEQG